MGSTKKVRPCREKVRKKVELRRNFPTQTIARLIIINWMTNGWKNGLGKWNGNWNNMSILGII